MTLKEKIDAYKEGFKKKAPQEAQEIMHRATNDLKNSPQMRNSIKVGDMAPDFKLKNTGNTDVALSDLLDRGPVVLSFYRGRW
ncbi:MAG: redoxin domain-containing protein [Desulfosarcina sp.]|nr:redoxin domain-containing protein [Desulfosarcina sp.]